VKEVFVSIYFSLLVALVGALIYGFAANPKLAELGRIMFWTGLLAFLLGWPGHPVNVLGK
jgi:hypothetical protein